MLIIGTKKKLPTVVVDQEGKPMDDLRMCAEDLMSAFKSGSVDDLEQALMALKMIIASEDEEQDQEMMR